MPITATRFTQFRPLGGDQDGDGFADAGDILRHTLTLNNTGTAATGVVVNDLLGGSTENGNLNISPIAFADSFTAVGNTLMEVGNATMQTGPQSNVVGNILSNDVDFLGDTFTISAFDATSLNGGTVNVITTGVDAGSFTYISAANFTGSDSFTYTIRDDGLDGIAGNSDDLVSIGTVTVTVSNQVWYVDSSFVGVSNGTSTNPFTTLASVSGATGPDTDGDIIYVNTGTGDYTGGITLLNNQTLHGEGTALVVGGFNLAAAGTDPTIANAAGNGVTLASGNTLTGFTVGNTTGFDIANTTTATVGNLTISNVNLAGTGGLFRADSGGTLNVTFDSASTTSAAGNGIHLAGATSGTFTVTGGAISGVAGTDVLVNGGTATIAIGSSITSNAGGSIDIGSHATGNVTLSGAINITGGTGISVHNNTSGIIAFTNGSKVVSTLGNNAVDLDSNVGATINFTGGGLDIDTTTGFGFQATGGGTFSVTGAGNSVTTTTGTALDLNGVTVGAGGVTFATATTNGAANGILITSVGQAAGSTGIDVLGGAIVNASSRGVDILSTSADVAIGATISTTGAGRSVEVTNSGSSAAGGNTIVFSGAIDENGTGINLDNNDQNTNGATINFTGGLDIDSTTNTGFNAINGGTINVTGTNTINNTTGIGVNVASTTIGASGLTFQTIATSGAANGIVLNTTGAGAFTVTGTGIAGSGGTITGSTGTAGISLTSTGPVTLGRMIIQNSAADGVFAQTVSGFRLDNSTVQNNGNAVLERGVELNNVTGTVTFLNTTMTGNAEDNLYVRNTSGTMNLTVTGSSFSSVSTSFGNDGIILIAAGTSTIVASITGSTFNNHRGDHFQATTEADSASTTHFTFSGNTLTGDRGVTHGGNDLGGGITINPGALTGTSNMTFNIANNNIQGATVSAITINRSGNTGTLQGTIQGNTIGTAGNLNSGSSQGDGISVFNNDNGTLTVRIHDNDIFQYSNLAGINLANRDGSGRLNATITNNTINSPGSFGDQGITVSSGATTTDAGDTYLDIENNTTAGSGTTANIRVRQRHGGDVFLENYGGGLSDTAAVVTYLQNRNTGAETAVASVQNSPPQGFFTTAAVPLPNAPLLPPAPLFVNPVPLPDDGKSGGDGTGGDFVPPGSTDPTDPAPGATDPVRTLPDAGQPVVVDDGVISAAELALIVEAAIQRWADAGATEEQIAAMRAVTFSVENMSGLQIGSNQGGHITIDDNAGGFNWFIDATPGDDSEYTGNGTQLTAIPGTVAAMRVDLLTTVMHELGHQIGLTDTYAAGDNDELMYGLVSMGERRLPGNDDLSGATGSPVAGIAFALTPINIGTIPAGQVVVVMWDSVVDGYTNQLVPTFVNFSTITGNNPGVFSVNSNSETMGPGGANNIVMDSLTLGNLVFSDVNDNGFFDGGDSGIDGVNLTLFADTNANGVFDGGDTQLATAITAGGGLYSFANLAPGDYIVRIDASNFTGGALDGRVTATGGNDPDDNVDNDDNGIDGAGGIVVSQAITLSHDNEPLPGPGNDTNNTLDFGFVTPNQPPTQMGLQGDAATWTENGAATLLDVGSNMTLADTDSADFDGGTLTVLLSGGVPAQDGIFIENVGTITSTANTVSFGATQIATYVGGGFGGGNIVFTFDADATPAAVQALMRALSYNNNGGDNPTGGTRSVTWTLVDGDGVANGGADTLLIGSSVDVLAVNDPPAGNDNTLFLPEDGLFVLTQGNFGFSDLADGNGFAGVVITTLPTNGRLLLGGTPITTAGTFVTAAQINSSQLAFQPDPNENGTPYGSFTFQVRDNGGILNGGQDTDQSANTMTFDVNPINDAPIVTFAAPTAGGETLVNTTVTDTQNDAAVAAFAAGGHVVVWTSNGQDGSGTGVYAQRYDASGAPLGSETLVNSTTTATQFEPDVAALADGSYVVVWSGNGIGDADGVFMQRYDAAGVAQGGETRVNGVTAGNQSLPSIAALADGGYVVVWQLDTQDIYGQRFNASGVAQGSEFVVNTVVAGNQQFPSVTGLAGGGFAVTWFSDQEGNGQGVYVRRFDALGVGQGNDVRANTFTTNDQSYSSIGSLQDGGYVVAWASLNQDGTLYSVYAQRYSATGTPVGGEFRVNTTLPDSQEVPTIAGLADGGFVITWRSFLQDGSDYGVYAQRYDAAGATVGVETQINTTTTGTQLNPDVAALPGNGYVVAWHGNGVGDTSGVFSQLQSTAFVATEQVALSLKGRITVSDVDAGAAVVTATLSVGYGVLNVSVGTSGATIDSGNGTGTVVVTGTIAQINALLNSDATSIVTFTADTDAPPASTALTVTVNDGGATGADPMLTGGPADEQGSAGATINILPVNDAPEGADKTVVASEDDPYVFLTTDFGFTDLLDNNAFAGVVLTTLPLEGDLRLNGVNITITDFITAADISAGLLTFLADPDEFGTAYASFDFQVRDDGGILNGGQDTDQSAETMTIDVTADNFVPVVDLNSGTPGVDDTNIYVENGAASGLGTAITVTDNEGDMITGAVITITDPSAGDLLSANLPLPGGITIHASSTATMIVLTGTASAATYATALGQLGYSNTGEDPTAGGNIDRVITVTVSDAMGTSAPATMTMAVSPVNDEPTLTATAVNPAFTEGGVSVDLFSGVLASTIESGQSFTSLTLTVSDVTDGADEILGIDGTAIALTNGNSVVSTHGMVNVTVLLGTATVTFTSAGVTAAELQTLIDGLSYGNAGQNPTDANRVVTITQLVDSGSDTPPSDAVLAPNIVSTVDVNAVNDGPVNTVPGAQTINEDGSFTLSAGNGNAIQVADPDAATLTVTLTVAHGTLTLASNAGLSFSGGSDGTADPTMTFSGTAAAINAALDSGLTYNPTAHYNGPDSISVLTTDSGQTGAGGTLQDNDSISITVNSVNDAPSGANNTLTGSEDDLLVLTAADFGFTDPADSNAFLAVIIDTFPANGTLFLDSDGPGGAAPVDLSTLGSGVFVSVTDINAGHLYFQPDPDEFGDNYASFTFRVQDDGGMLNGGLDRDQSAKTMTIDIDPDNLPPVVDLDGATGGVDYTTTFVEDGAAVAIGSGVIVSDPDVGLGDMIESATITLTDRVAGDSLTLTGALPGGIIAVTTPSAGAITIQITGAGTGAQYQALIQSILYATTSQDPTVGGTDLARTITVTVNDGTIDSAVATTTVNITAVDDAPVAQPDSFTITESGTIVAGNLFADNGSGADSDPDGPPLSISAVGGGPGANVGSQFTLDSGALLTVNANGTFNYNPNGVFLPTPTAGSGASNTPGHDSFTYTLAGGNTVTVSITLTGLDTDDTLLGTAGADILMGGLGNDFYFVENGSDQVIEAVGQGYDRVFASVSYALAAGTEIEVLSTVSWGATTAINLTGNALGNVIYGNAGANTLNGGGGTDVLIGFGGDDNYFVDSATDAVIEDNVPGLDSVFSSVNYGLAEGSYVEVLSAVSWGATTALSLAGNSFANIIYGNAGANTLNGGGGADVLIGFGGDDAYIVDNAGDVVIEAAGQGYDTVYALADHTLAEGTHVEVLSAIDWSSTAPINLTGNSFANTIYGNAGANTLNGGGGADTLVGLGGNDTYYVDSASDSVIEAAGGGNDSVYASSNYTLGAGQEIEFLSSNNFSSMTPLNLTGNELANTIYGNAGGNILDGKGGNDALVGLDGADIFAFTTALGAGNVDLVFGFVAGSDKIALDDAIFGAGIGTAGAFNANAFHVGAAAHDLDDRIIYNSATGQLFFDADGSGAGAAVQFATLSPGLTLTASDFQVI